MMKRLFVATAATSCAALVSPQAHALESGVSPYPVGASGTSIATMPPIPGLFLRQQFSYSEANGLYDNNGHKLGVPFRSSSFAATSRLVAAYPATWLGANVYSQVVLPAVTLHTDIAGSSGRDHGLSNITLSPVILQWSLSPRLTAIAGMDLSLANGSYSASNPSVAVGYTSLQPVLAARYNVPNGPDVGAITRLMLNRTNSDTGYRSGDGVVVDFSAGWNFGQWKAGLVGGYLSQYEDDRSHGALVKDNRARLFKVGPSIDYNAGPLNININYQHGLYAANTSKSHSLWVNFSFPLWAKPPGPRATP
ncbi:MAG: hypothetical protein GAK30_00352 [Paracidovorax wautersii]|uniref:MetA-pathway of phenol degradation n=1 Tax=Paracidovorax wautersii TaxID=1177982 RepID=A0A7V8FRY2_9BURK|nr:MAG: hypothetical protein GAK30_00352 [Paracidovorax wautersii]